MHEHLVEGFRTTGAPYEIALTVEKAPLLLVDALTMVQEYVTKEYESAVEIKKNPTQTMYKVLHLDSQKELFNSICFTKIKITTSNY